MSWKVVFGYEVSEQLSGKVVIELAFRTEGRVEYH
jgi:hypothetical protein